MLLLAAYSLLLICSPSKAQELVGHWKFDKSSEDTTYDTSGTPALDGIFHGGSDLTTNAAGLSGKLGEAAILNGNRGDYIQIGEDDDFPLIPDGINSPRSLLAGTQ